jgi:RsiW-degrading membrane proteinase PrsW (M82 family)
MTEPPPPPPPSRDFGNFHLPGTNIFRPIRQQLAAYEHPAEFKSDLEVPLAFLIAFATGAILGVIFPMAIHGAFSSVLGTTANWFTPIVVAPITEETSKAACMLITAYALVRVLPNRRYGAALGAATGLGFAIMEDIVYGVLGLSPGFFGLVRLIETPVTHPLFSASVGVGVFLLVAKMRSGKTFFESILGYPLLFLGIGMLNHSMWNLTMQVGFPLSMIVAIFLFPSPWFVLVLRDFLGGHFNFRHFFEPLPEPTGPYWKEPPPPPPAHIQTSKNVKYPRKPSTQRGCSS